MNLEKLKIVFELSNFRTAILFKCIHIFYSKKLKGSYSKPFQFNHKSE